MLVIRVRNRIGGGVEMVMVEWIIAGTPFPALMGFLSKTRIQLYLKLGDLPWAHHSILSSCVAWVFFFGSVRCQCPAGQSVRRRYR